MINRNVMSQIDIFEATSCKPEYVAAVNRLLLLTVDGEVMGMCAVGFYTSPTGRKAWIEDVVVDAQCRGLHLGERLVASAVSFAEREGFNTLMLTSRPSRVAANRLYQKVGFERKETNVYLKVKSPSQPSPSGRA